MGMLFAIVLVILAVAFIVEAWVTKNKDLN